MSNTKTTLGFIAGAALGAIAAILLAPDSGANTRRKIVDRAGDLKDSITGKFSREKDAAEGVNTTGDPNIANMHSGVL